MTACSFRPFTSSSSWIWLEHRDRQVPCGNPAALAWVELIEHEEVHVRWYGYVNMNCTRIKQSSTNTIEKYWSMQPGVKLDKALRCDKNQQGSHASQSGGVLEL